MLWLIYPSNAVCEVGRIDDAKEFCFLHDRNWGAIEEKLRIWVWFT